MSDKEQKLPNPPICERWENGNFRLVNCNLTSLQGGGYYSFHKDGTPMQYCVTDTEGNVKGDSYTWWENGQAKTFVKRKGTEKGLFSESFLYDREGKLNKHERLLDGRKHGKQYYNVEGREEVIEWWYKGVIGINPEIAEHPERITQKMVMEEGNAEVRRVYLDIIGVENFLTKFDYEVLDIDVNKNDILYRIDVGKLIIHMVKFICPSTADVYFHFIPPDLNTIGEAKCWMFGIDGEKFEPVIEA